MAQSSERLRVKCIKRLRITKDVALMEQRVEKVGRGSLLMVNSNSVTITSEYAKNIDPCKLQGWELVQFKAAENHPNCRSPLKQARPCSLARR